MHFLNHTTLPLSFPAKMLIAIVDAFINLLGGALRSNKFYQRQQMWGLCQNVEIIHEHHHHFYEVMVAPKSRNRSLFSKTANPESFRPLPSHPSPSAQNDPQQEAQRCRLYRTKRAYLKGAQRGIEVLSLKQEPSFQVQRINLQKAGRNQHHYQHLTLAHTHAPLQQNLHLPSLNIPPQRTAPEETFKESTINCVNHMANIIKGQQSLAESVQQSTPTVCKMPISPHQANLKANHYLNLHQLKQSTMGFKNASLCDTYKKNSQTAHKADNNISLCVPADQRHKSYYHQSSEIYLRDKDSIVTRKEKEMVSAFKTQKMFDDARSIVSLQSLEHSRMNIDESIIVSRTMDFFTCITPRRELPHCSIYLARQNHINWMVSVRQFEFKHEDASLKQAKIYAFLSDATQSSEVDGHFPVLQLYRMMMEGSGLSKSIFFIQEPFEVLLTDYLAHKKHYFKTVPSAFNHFLQDLSQQVWQALLFLFNKGLILCEGLQVGDLAISNGQYKLHSLYKFQLARHRQVFHRESTQGVIQKLKSSIIESVIFS